MIKVSIPGVGTGCNIRVLPDMTENKASFLWYSECKNALRESTADRPMLGFIPRNTRYAFPKTVRDIRDGEML